MPASPRAAKPTNLSLDNDLVLEARRLGINVSRAAEAGLRKAVGEARAAEWQRENAEAIASANAWVEANGLPLARYRQF
jgi:antitoxin CcdA